ncbi:cell surface protein SprA [uncultured Sunxiuqinia sp.]|uniref:T9SS outer membrane translocon Sov/SprA n=1 Tax=uncultured Sunxiuqinia sp. TaxID=1573825 RepID=UPI00262841E2|nr:cell surface protein SprA [uncultured Sunxiuqinia sp.]
MKKSLTNILATVVFPGVLSMGWILSPPPTNGQTKTSNAIITDSLEIDTTGTLPYPFEDEPVFEFPDSKDSSELFLSRPSNINTEMEYDPETGEYIFYEKIGNLNYRLPKTMTLQEFVDYDFKNSIRNYWRTRGNQLDMETQGSVIPSLTVGGEAFNRIFGGNSIDIRPQGYVEVSFGYQMNAIENPAIPERLRKTPTFDFDQKIQMNVMGSIGEKMKMRVNYNTEATFDYENKMNIDYTGDEDEILKKVEAGNVSLPLNGSLITGGTNLFGVKTEMQFGKLNLTTIFSQNKGETQVIETEGGAQKSTFEIEVLDYDANRHFFLAQYFRDTYNEALAKLPVVRSSITINKIEVWVTNKSNQTNESRNILAFMDLGEHQKNIYNTVPGFQETTTRPYPENIYPFNEANNLYTEIVTSYSDIREANLINKTMQSLDAFNFKGGQDFEKVEQARKLSPSEYTVHENLGYVSLNSSLNTDEVLMVAYNYTANGKTYQVGEFSTDGIEAPQTLVMKLLKGTNLSPRYPTWKLMMKNIYSLNAYQLSKENFILDVLYQNDSGTDINYLPETNLEGHILLNVLNVDNLNTQLDPGSDGVFDYIEGITVLSSSGRIIFPVLEPFGSHLADSISDPALAEKYAYRSLYDSTKTYAEQDTKHNKFILKGSYEGSSSSEIALERMNVAQGSVKVTAGGHELQEYIDYTVDYTLGRVKIINAGLLESGTPIRISTESEDLFSVQRKTLVGTHANYAFSDNFNLGATVLHMNERPLTQKVTYGEDPISNTIWGLDVNYNTESNLLTTLVDKLPFIETKEPSSISMEAEFAQLIPGHSKVIDKEGTVYIDDFEATKTSINLKARQAWVLASTPQKQEDLFPEGNLNDDLAYGYNRAKLAWYIIDPLFLRNTSQTPSHIKGDRNQQRNHFVREVFLKEIFPDKETPTGTPTNIPVLDLAYYPNEKGPYNFDTAPSAYSAGVNSDGKLNNPESRWAGIMRKIETTDFEAANIEYIEFWMMDPFVYDKQNGVAAEGGDLYFNLGDISEDLLKDSRKSFENGLPETAELQDVDTTVWGRVSTKQSIVNAFANDPVSRQFQDIGFDGLNDDDERSFFQSYLQALEGILAQTALTEALNDPASDNYHYYRGSDFDAEQASILTRYKNYNGPDGNSPTSEMSPESYPTTASTMPDIEDINNDNTLNEYERYFQYRISIRPEDMQLGQNFITDIRVGQSEGPSGGVQEVNWYQFKVPVSAFENKIDMDEFRSIRFMRVFLKGFQDTTILRFATMDLVRADWRRFTDEIDETSVPPSPQTEFEISAVNIEENSRREPVNYILPPGIDRVIDPANPQLLQLNEQSLVLKVIDLQMGDVRAAYKTLGMDFRRYRRLKLELHAEEIDGYPLNDDQLHYFIRLGTDENNYYEYEVPLKLTEPGFYNGDIESQRYLVWPDENRIDIPLDLFTEAKMARNALSRQAGASVNISDVYETSHQGWNNNKNIVKVKGTPNLAEVGVILMGVRHKQQGNLNPGPKSVEVWANELRLTDFDEEGGWAANARVSARLADLGSVVVAGRTRSSGFGSIDQTMNERALDDLVEYDISSNFELGKFFPEKAKVRIPLYVGVSKSISNPKYNPLDPDIEMKDAVDQLDSRSERDSLKQIAQDYVSRKSINFTNVKVDKMSKSGKPRLYDPTNFSVTYAYNEMKKRNVNTEYSLEKNYRGMFSYNFNNRPKLVEPFKKVNFLKGRALQLVRDFNFYPMPTQLSYRTDLYRHYKEVQARNLTNPNMIIPRTFDKEFLWNRYFDLNFNLTRSLKLDFSSQGTARIDEPAGRINRRDDDYELKRDSIITNLLNLGRPILYHHTFNASYVAPLNKIPFLNWVSATGRYQAQYDWYAGPITDESTRLGNTAENARVAQLNGQVNMLNLYNKVSFLKEVNQKFGSSTRSARSSRSRAQAATRSRGKQEDPRYKIVTYESARTNLKANTAKVINHKLKTEDVQVTLVNPTGGQVEGEVVVVNENRVTVTVPDNTSQVMVRVSGKREVGDGVMLKIAQYTARTLMSVKNISVSYSSSDGTIMPGFLPEPAFFGAGNYTPDPVTFGNIGSSNAPGFPFLFGWQDDDFARKAISKGWYTNDTTLNAPYRMNHNETFSIRANVEPIPFLRIDLTANRSYSENMQEYYSYDHTSGSFSSNSRTLQGNFSMSINTWSTAFSKIGEAEIQESAPFQEMMDYRRTIAWRLAGQRIANPAVGYSPEAPHTIAEGYPAGYGPTSQQVLIPAFIAAYTGQDPSKVSLDPFPSIKHMRPNWRVTYDGLVTKIEGLNKVLKTLNINHAYRSSYNVGSFITNLSYNDQVYNDGFSYVLNELSGNFIGRYDINVVSINEQFSPLINMDVTWLNDMTTRAEVSRSRNLALNFANNQLTEVLTNEYTFGLGYRFERMDLIIKTKRSQKAYSNDLNIRADVSFRKNKTLIRKLVEATNQLTAGQNAITIKTTADYMLSDRFQMRVYFDKVINKPFTSLSFPTSNTNFGLSFRFTLAQ